MTIVAKGRCELLRSGVLPLVRAINHSELILPRQDSHCFVLELGLKTRARGQRVSAATNL